MSIPIAHHRFRIVTAFLAALLSTSVRADVASDLPPRTILLFVATWCAPCHAEVARLPEIAAAARPYRVLIVSLDDARRADRMLRDVPRDHRWQPAAVTLARVRDTLFADVAGLPYSVAVDARGQVCGNSRHGLTAVRARALLTGCRNPP